MGHFPARFDDARSGKKENTGTSHETPIPLYLLVETGLLLVDNTTPNQSRMILVEWLIFVPRLKHCRDQ